MRPVRDRNTHEWNNGVGIDRSLTTLKGDLNHLIQPVIGNLRLQDGGDDGPNAWIVDRLYHALELAEQFLVNDQRIEKVDGEWKTVPLPRVKLVEDADAS